MGVGRRAGLLLATRRTAVVADENEAIGGPGAAARRETLRELAPRGDDLLAAATALGLALAAAVGVVDRIHGHAAHMRPAAQPPGPPCLAQRLLGVVRVADDAERAPIWEAQKHDNPGFADYETKTSRQIPVVILERAE